MPLLGGVGRASGIGAIGSADESSGAGGLRGRRPGQRGTKTGRATNRWHAVAVLLLLDQGASLLAANDTPPAGSNTAYDWHLPRGFPTPAVPTDNPMSAAKVALGRDCSLSLGCRSPAT